MTNTTDEYWEVDGVSLNTYARNISSWGGSRLGVPTLRGEDDHIPFKPGDKWLPKLAGPRVISLGMWVIGADDDGVEGADPHALFNEHWRELRRLMWNPRKQLELTKRVRYTDGVQVLHGKAQFIGGLEPSMTDTSGAKFVVDLKLADPYFRPAAPTVQVISLAQGSTLLNPGDDIVIDPVLTFSGGGPYTLTNDESGLQLVVNNTGNIVVDCGAFTAVKDGNVNVLANISTNLKDGSMEWMHLLRDVNDLTLGGGGQVSISFKPVYL